MELRSLSRSSPRKKTMMISTQPRQHVLEWPGWRPDFSAIKHVQRDPKKGHLLTAPIQADRAWEHLQRGASTLSKAGVQTLWCLYSRRMEAECLQPNGNSKGWKTHRYECRYKYWSVSTCLTCDKLAPCVYCTIQLPHHSTLGYSGKKWRDGCIHTFLVSTLNRGKQHIRNTQSIIVKAVLSQPYGMKNKTVNTVFSVLTASCWSNSYIFDQLLKAVINLFFCRTGFKLMWPSCLCLIRSQICLAFFNPKGGSLIYGLESKRTIYATIM